MEPSSVVVVHNVVATANFGCELDLARIAWAYKGEYNPSTFAAVQLRLPKPRTTALVFGSGKVVCTGARNEFAALVALNTYFYMVWRLHPDARMVSQCIQNIVSSGSLGSSVRIDEMAKEMALSLAGHYEPEIFPGFRLTVKGPDLKALVFTAGKVVLTGGKNREDIARAWSILRVVVEKFLTKNTPGMVAVTHNDIVQLKISNRKRKVM